MNKKYIMPFVCGASILGLISVGIYCHFTLHSSYQVHNFKKVFRYGKYMKHISMDYERLLFGSMIDNVFEDNKGYDVHEPLKAVIYSEALVSKTNNTALYTSIRNYLESYNAKISDENAINNLYESIDTINGYEYFFNKKKMIALCRSRILSMYLHNLEKNDSKEELNFFFDTYQQYKKHDDYDVEYFYMKLAKKFGKMNDNITLLVESVEDEEEQQYFVKCFEEIITDTYNKMPTRLRKVKNIQNDYEQSKVCIELLSSD